MKPHGLVRRFRIARAPVGKQVFVDKSLFALDLAPRFDQKG
jgi:hypothetical protein